MQKCRYQHKTTGRTKNHQVAFRVSNMCAVSSQFIHRLSRAHVMLHTKSQLVYKTLKSNRIQKFYSDTERKLCFIYCGKFACKTEIILKGELIIVHVHVIYRWIYLNN